MEPFQRAGKARLQLSLAAYSFRDFFQDSRQAKAAAGTAPGRGMTMLEFIDYCAEQGCAGAELTSYYFPKEATPEYFREVRRHAFLRGVAISGTSVGNNFALPRGPERDKQIASVKAWIGHAAVMGAPHIRIFAGAAPRGWRGRRRVKLCVEAIEECCAYAGSRGIFLGLENHGGIVAEPEGLLEIVKAVKSPWFGVNLDTGNFHTADPYAALAPCAPYAVNVQVKAEMKREGAKEEEATDLARIAQILREANYQGWVALEYESKPDPREAVPGLLAQLREALAAPAAAAAAVTAGKLLFDGKSLAGWKPTEFSGAGEVKVEDGAIVLEAGNDLTGVTYPGELPKTNYEVSLEAKRIEGSDFFCALTMPVGETHCTLVVGGWGGGLVGISSIDGQDASENETQQVMKFDKDRWYKIRARVTPAKIEVWIDEEQVVNVDISQSKISMRLGEIEVSMPFGIASYRTRAAIRGIKVRPL